MGYKIVLVDGHTILWSGLKNLLQQEKQFSDIKNIESGESAITTVFNLQPDLLIMDLSMGAGLGIEAIRTIKKTCVNTKVIVLTAQKGDAYVRASMSAGADAYVFNGDSYDNLLLAISLVAENKKYVSEIDGSPYDSAALLSSNSSEKSQQTPAKQVCKDVTRREHEVLKLVAEGLKTREIAVELSVSPKTVENHRANMLRKLNFNNTPALIYFAMEHGLL